jgi:hypothetical protein
MHLVPVGSRAQVTIKSIVKDLRQLSSTSEVTCIRKSKRPPVVPKMLLEVGDKLNSDSRNLIVNVKCGTADVTLASPFRVTFVSTNGKHCFTGYESSGGTMIVKSSDPTNTESVAGKLATKRTIYEVNFRRAKWKGLARFLLFAIPAPRVHQWIVYEGAAEVQTHGFSRTIRQHEKVLTVGGRVLITNTGLEDIKRVAGLYAMVDVSQMPTSNPQELQAAFFRLTDFYMRVLFNPYDHQLQTNLANEQQRLGIPMAEIMPAPSESQLQVTLSPKTLSVKNECKKMHRFRVTLDNLPFVYLRPASEFEVRGGGESAVRLAVDPYGMKAGEYRGELIVTCLDCTQGEICGLKRQTVEVTVNIKDKQP